MTSPEDSSPLEARLDFVHAQVLQLQSRVAALEHELGHRSQTPELAPSPFAAPALVLPELVGPAQPYVRQQEALPVAPRSSEEASPMRVLALAGGAALLIGLAFFVGFVIEQGWLTPALRFGLGATFSALLTLAAWPVARRGHEPVAGAIGGAGLGGWFAAWLVARHVHELVAAPLTFAALGLGAAACLLIADRLRLRLMAGLATAAACATPVLVGAHGDRLHELMLYQTLVISALLVLDWRQRWPELPTIGLLATWILGAQWASEHLHADTGGGPLLAWASVMLVASATSAWRLLIGTADEAERAREGERVQIVARLLVAGVASWNAAAWVFGVTAPAFGAASLLLAAWHMGLGVQLHRRADTHVPSSSRASEVFSLFGWMQALVAVPLMLAAPQPSVVWWIAMALAAMAIPWSGFGRIRGAMIMLPILLGVAVCFAYDEPWSLLAGLSLSAVPLIASLWPAGDRPRPVLWLSLSSALLWAGVVLGFGPEGVATQLSLGLVPTLVILVWACVRPSRTGLEVAGFHLGLSLVGAFGALLESGALVTSEPAHLALATPLIVLVGLGIGLLARVLADPTIGANQVDDIGVSGVGIVLAAMLALILLLVVAAGASSLGQAGGALAQIGYTLAAASTGLVLLIAGLRMNQSYWRQLGLAAIGGAGLKVVLFDLAAAAVVWRALGFVGLGAILIAGSLAYSRAQARLKAAKPSG